MVQACIVVLVANDAVVIAILAVLSMSGVLASAAISFAVVDLFISKENIVGRSCSTPRPIGRRCDWQNCICTERFRWNIVSFVNIWESALSTMFACYQCTNMLAPAFIVPRTVVTKVLAGTRIDSIEIVRQLFKTRKRSIRRTKVD